MKLDTAWKCLSVQDFLAQCNWENIPSQLEVSSDSPVITPKSWLQSWQCMITQDFFSLNNWSGQAIVTDNLEPQELSPETFVLDLRLPTAEFWQGFNWSGTLEVTPQPKVDQIIQETEAIIAEVEEFTLKDLSQLF